LQGTQTGLVTENVLTLRMSVSEARYGANAAKGAATRYYQALEDRMLQIPGVRSAAFINMLPLQSWGRNGDVSIDGRPPSEPGRAPFAELRVVSPRYFRTLGIPLRRGREFNQQDTDSSTPVAIINETLARRYFPNEDPIGRKTNRGTVVGIVADVRQVGLDQPPAAELYQPLSQSPQLAMTAAVATALPVDSVVGAVGAAIREVDPTQAIYNVKTMNRVVSESLSNQNLYLWLLGLFAGLALVLAIAGIYGVISYAVTARTQEFGIRLALGAQGSQVLGLVLSHGAVLVALGLALGVAGAFSLTRLLKALLIGVTPTDPATFAVVGALLAAVALAACLIPARRAMRVDPVIALRYE
jgi:predicted permease